MKHNPTPSVATAGEALIDLILDEEGRLQPCLGGAIFNLSRALSRQGLGTLYLNPLSRDRFGRQLAARLEEDGVHLAAPAPVVQVTSLAVVGVDKNGHPDYSFYRQGVADRATTAANLTDACEKNPQLSVVCTGALALSPDDAETYLPWLSNQRLAGRTIVIDANLRPSVMPDLALYRRHVLAALQLADVIKVSDEDLECLNLPGADASEQASYLLNTTRAHFLALTRGADGATLFTRYGQVFHARQCGRLDVVDTVGAGDCFLAGLVVSMLEQKLATHWGTDLVAPEQARNLLGNAIASASICVMRRGCVPPLRAEVQTWLGSTNMEFMIASYRNTVLANEIAAV